MRLAKVRIGVLCALLIARLVGAAPSVDGQRLVDTATPRGTLIDSNERAVAMLLAEGRRVCWWTQEGVFQRCVSLPGTREGDLPSALVGRGSTFLACMGTRTGPPQRCAVLDVETGSIRGTFGLDPWPCWLYPGTTGFLVQTLGHASDEPVVMGLDEQGRYQGSVRLPSKWREAAVAAGPLQYLWFPRAFGVGDELWAIPAGHYSFWRIGVEGGDAVAVPADLFGSQCQVDLSARASWVDELRSPGSGPRSGTFSISAVRRVTAVRNHVFVLVVENLAAEDRGCRVDAWEFTPPRLVQSFPIPGPCPTQVAAGVGGIWSFSRGRVAWLPIAGRAL